jgi:hypothetical protein
VSCDSESLADEGMQRKIGSLVGLVRCATGCSQPVGRCSSISSDTHGTCCAAPVPTRRRRMNRRHSRADRQAITIAYRGFRYARRGGSSGIVMACRSALLPEARPGTHVARPIAARRPRHNRRSRTKEEPPRSGVRSGQPPKATVRTPGRCPRAGCAPRQVTKSDQRQAVSIGSRHPPARSGGTGRRGGEPGCGEAGQRAPTAKRCPLFPASTVRTPGGRPWERDAPPKGGQQDRAAAKRCLSPPASTIRTPGLSSRGVVPPPAAVDKTAAAKRRPFAFRRAQSVRRETRPRERDAHRRRRPKDSRRGAASFLRRPRCKT